MPTNEQVSYTAGILDGEGSISLLGNGTRLTKAGRPSRSPMLIIQVSNTHRGLLDWMQTTREAHRTAWCWRVRNHRAAALLVAEEMALRWEYSARMATLNGRTRFAPDAV